MKRKKPIPAAKRRRPPKPVKYAMRLYITGATARSTRAITNLRRLCDEHLPGRYELRIIDVYQQPELARDGQIIAAPTLVKMLPAPLRRFIGDMSNTRNILNGLEIQPGTDGGNSGKPPAN